MKKKKSHVKNWKVYCIIDNSAKKKKNLECEARNLFLKKVGALQLRYKNMPSYELLPMAKRISKLAKRFQKSFLINDRPDVAFASGADGVHLGEGDMSVETIRRLFGKKMILGKTVHSKNEAKKTKLEKIDYVGVGPIYKTPIKSHLKKRGARFIKEIKKNVNVPIFAIGGINKRNVKDVLIEGADGICVTRACSETKELFDLFIKARR